ncbi:MAG: hypothetical protein M1829_002598 [Trizodia sp. TS-e1964]|nr:MAG: hypothetical protein M1829_002598 [Trizodia sp. TS-e1964]
MCQKTYNSENAYRNHLKSLKHKAMLRSAYDRTSTHPATEISDSDTMDEISLPQTPPRHIGSSDHPSISVALAKCLLCLFCNYRSPTISLNVVHMERIHGMFIPERKYLENLQGLLQHLYQKISEFHECLYCGKFKISSSALQTHMRDKGHCMIAFDSEAEMIEIGQFYDFRSTYPDQDLAKEEVEEANESDSWETDSSASSLDSEELTAVPVDREPHYYNKLYKHPHHCHHNPRPHHNKDGWHSHALHHFAVYRSEYELHLPSGRSVGHRSLARYYQQNLHNYPNTQLSLESQARADSTNQDSEVKRQNLQQVVSRANGGLVIGYTRRTQLHFIAILMAGNEHAETEASAHISSRITADHEDSDTGVAPDRSHRIQHSKSILTLVVSDQNIFAGTQGGEILIWSLETFQLAKNIQGHRGSVLCLILSQKRQLLFSSAGDAIINVWCTENFRRVYSIYSTYDVGDVFCVAFSPGLNTVYFGAQNTSIQVCLQKALDGGILKLQNNEPSNLSQWYDFNEKDSRFSPNPISHPTHRNHRFFDSKGPGGKHTPRIPLPNSTRPCVEGGQQLEVATEHILQYAHYGYVYSMLLAHGLNRDSPDKEILISGGGDGTIKLWDLHAGQDEALSESAIFNNGDNSVLALALDGTFLYAGLAEGDINVWDLDTQQLVRSVKVHTSDVLTLAIGGGLVFSGAATGRAKILNQKYECIGRWRAHRGLVLASSFASYGGKRIYITGGNDDCLAIWDVSECVPEPNGGSKSINGRFLFVTHSHRAMLSLLDQLLSSLSRLVSFKTVSSMPQYAGDCRRGATWLRSLFKSFGATTEMFKNDHNLNPVVFAKFKGNSLTSTLRKKILFYGHYDVIAAENEKGNWIVDPFQLRGINGYLYGRGVSDNKGPVIAAIYAVAELVSEQALEADIVFLIEGEEECGSRGFESSIKKHKKTIGDVDWILLANSYWLDDDVPCLTYGLRGVIHATIQVESDHPDLHSGVDGSALMDESLKDLVMLLAKLTAPHGRIEIPDFYNPILPVTIAEKELYDDITNTLIHRRPELGDPDSLSASLMQRWREPSLTLHRFKVSGPENSTVIPRLASASLSLRLVPDQETAKVRDSLVKFLSEEFCRLGTKNRLSISIEHEADPWLGNPSNEIYRSLEEAVMEVWGLSSDGPYRRPSVSTSTPEHSSESNLASMGGDDTPLSAAAHIHPCIAQPSLPSPVTSSVLSFRGDHSTQAVMQPNQLNCFVDLSISTYHGKRPRKPLYIREGGSIPSIRFLEKEFGAPAAHLPCGQASDSAHLDNERLRLSNLYNSRDIFKRVFKDLPKR